MLIPFHEVFPDVADAETRSIMRMQRDGSGMEEFFFVEMYCPDPECDCRRVTLWVVRAEDGTVAATIGHAFEPPSEHEDPSWRQAVDEQTFLDPLNPQSEQAEELLDIFENVVLGPDYQARLERHYQMVKDADTSEWEDELHDDMPDEQSWDASDVEGGDDRGRVFLDDAVVEEAMKKRQRLKRRMTSSERKTAKRAAKLARYRMETLVINSTWNEDTFANIVAVRQAPGGTYTRMFAVVDLGCVGLTAFDLATGLSKSEARDQLEGAFPPESPSMECSPALARRILHHAAAWSEQAGLETSSEFFAADAFLGRRADWRDIDELVPLGEQGQHFYVPSPDSDWEKTVDVLEETLGAEGFGFIAPR